MWSESESVSAGLHSAGTLDGWTRLEAETLRPFDPYSTLDSTLRCATMSY